MVEKRFLFYSPLLAVPPSPQPWRRPPQGAESPKEPFVQSKSKVSRYCVRYTVPPKAAAAKPAPSPEDEVAVDIYSCPTAAHSSAYSCDTAALSCTFAGNNRGRSTN